MTEDQAHRFNVHAVMLTAELEMALVKLQAEREIGKNYAVLYLIVEGAFKLGYLGREDYDLLIKRYSRKLVDVTRENRAQRESSHVPVRTQEQQKEQQLLEEKDRQFKGMLDQWQIHRSKEWRRRAAEEAGKYVDKLESARTLKTQYETETKKT
jgi:hypothetical protein